MVAAERGWYEALVSGDEGERTRLPREEMENEGMEQDEDESYEEEEVEEMLDDEPMRITGRLYLGSIDAARNVLALQRKRIRGVLALLGNGEEAGAVGEKLEETYRELQITRRNVAIQDSKDGDLLRRLPGILAELRKLLEQAERDDTNVLVHCIAGRSRSVSVLVAKMISNDPQRQTVQDVVDEIRIIRPWIEINPYFMRDLHLFRAALTSADGASFTSEYGSVLKTRALPRLDFGADLVDGILHGSKTITMRLQSDIRNDQKSDLADIFPYSLVVATSGVHGDRVTPRSPFAYLLIDQVTTDSLSTLDTATLHKSGFSSTEQVLSVLQQFYPDVTISTPLLMLHFHCLGTTK